ncbi:MAG: hypothetical protein H6708_31720 [Kofleriaceae bacterium]|nr:hypothetical protein [Kofleriaceae bacterium]
MTRALHGVRGAIVVGLALVAVGLGARVAAAQSCGGQRSTCRACHEERGERPVERDGSPWHGDHAFGDFCARCHGGDATATRRDAAHVGLAAPLTEAACADCHADPAPLLAGYVDEAARRPPAAAVTGPPSRASPSPPAGVANTVAAALVLVLGVGGTIAIVRAERRRRGAPVASPLRARSPPRARAGVEPDARRARGSAS